MNYLRGFSSVLGSPSAENQPSPHETVARLCDRVASSTLLEDRRDAVRALKSLSKKYRLEVGSQAMDLLINVLQMDRSDTEIVGMSLETLCNIMSTDPNSHDTTNPKDGSTPSDSEVGLQFTELFIKTPDNVTLLLGILEEYEFHVRWPTVKLLTMLLTNKGNLLQQCILVSPMGVSRLMDLLSDSREIIRNEGLLLLIQLTRSNAAIQKIVAFENAFDRLIEIIAEEGYSDGGVVVEDCLLLMQNLLKSNVSNQNFYREGSFIQRINPFFEMSALAMQGSDDEPGWSEQKVSNVQLMLKVVRILVSPDNPQQASTSAQKIMNQCGLLRLLCAILMASGIPADILTETINTVSEVIRGFPANQEYFSQVNAPSEPPRPAIVVLLMSMINDKQPASLRCAVLYCFQCYLYKNEQGQHEIVSTLLPSSADAAGTVSAGQLLCAGLFSPDPLSNWCAAVAMAHCLKQNQTQKEQLLRVQLATSVGNPPVSLLQQCTNMLAQGGDTQTRVGIVVLLCSWLANCPIAVAHFLHSSANVPYLMGQVEAHGEEGERLVGYLCALLLGLCLAFNDDSVQTCQKNDLRILINKRIGLDNLLEKVSNISKSEYFTAAVKSPEIKLDGVHQVLFDHEFTRLFKKLDAAVSKAVEEEESTESAPSPNHRETNPHVDNHDSIVSSYKELIREQDEEIGRLKSRCNEMESAFNQNQVQLQQQTQEIFQLRHQLAQGFLHQADVDGGLPPTDNNELFELRNQINDMQIGQRSLEQQMQDRDSQVHKLEKDLEITQAQLAVATAAAELADSSDASGGSSALNANQLEDLAGLRRTVTSLQGEIESLRTQNAALQHQLDSSGYQGSPGSDSNVQAAVEQTRLEAAGRIGELETKLREVLEENASQTKEHEDLLVMLADQEEKIAQYKKILKDAGHEVSEDEDEEDGDEDDEEEEEEEEVGEEEEEEEEDDTQQQQQQQQVTPDTGEEHIPQQTEPATQQRGQPLEPEQTLEEPQQEQAIQYSDEAYPVEGFGQNYPVQGSQETQPIQGYQEMNPAQGYQQDQRFMGFRHPDGIQDFHQPQWEQGYQQTFPEQGYQQNYPVQGFEHTHPVQGFEGAKPFMGFQQSQPEQGSQQQPGGYNDVNLQGYPGEDIIEGFGLKQDAGLASNNSNNYEEDFSQLT